MRCYEHPEVGAVIQCQNCSKGLCRLCAERFNTALCQTCAQQIVEQEITNAKLLLGEIKGQRIKAMLAIVWAGAWMLFGINAAVFHSHPGEWWFPVILFFGFGGLPWLISKSMNQVETAESQLRKIRSDMFALSFGPGAASGMLVGKIILLIISFVFSAIITPFRLIRTIIDLKQLKTTRIELEKMIADNA